MTIRVVEQTAIHDERTFAVEELFFSTTDLRGFITSSNEVFVRISGYNPDELFGKPHNVIRHPDMPRVIFRTLWDELEAGRSVSAFVKNRAKDGSYYWVLAVARPIPGGYLSVRMKPTSPWFATFKSLYTELLACESEIENADGRRSAAIEASTAHLHTAIAVLGFADYSSLMRTVLVDEVTARLSQVGQVGRSAATYHPRWANAMSASTSIARELATHVQQIEGFTRLNASLLDRSGDLVVFAEDGKALALNAVLSARRLGNDGSVLAAVADVMKQTFPEVIGSTNRVIEQVNAAGAYMAEVSHCVALAALQNDVSAQFLEEIGGHDNAAESLGALQMMATCVADDVAAMNTAFRSVAVELSAAIRRAVQLESDLARLTAVERSGRIEASRVESTEGFLTLFDRTRTRLRTAVEGTRELIHIAEGAVVNLPSGADLAATVTSLIDALDSIESSLIAA